MTMKTNPTSGDKKLRVYWENTNISITPSYSSIGSENEFIEKTERDEFW